MYEIYAYPYGNPDAKLLLYRPNDPQALVLSPKLTREVSKGGSLVFTMTRDHAQYDMLQKLSTVVQVRRCLLYTSPSPRDRQKSRMPSSA